MYQYYRMPAYIASGKRNQWRGVLVVFKAIYRAGNVFNIDFYQVVKVSGKTADIRPIASSEVPGARYEPGSSSQVTAVKDSFTGPVEKHLIQGYDGKAYFHLTSYSSAYAWDGNPKSYSWGH